MDEEPLFTDDAIPEGIGASFAAGGDVASSSSSVSSLSSSMLPPPPRPTQPAAAAGVKTSAAKELGFSDIELELIQHVCPGNYTIVHRLLSELPQPDTAAKERKRQNARSGRKCTNSPGRSLSLRLFSAGHTTSAALVLSPPPISICLNGATPSSIPNTPTPKTRPRYRCTFSPPRRHDAL